VEPDEETVKAARDFFNLEFDEEPWSDLTPAGRGLHSSTFGLNLSAFCGIGVHLRFM
jgi:hypothetical protein